MFLNSRIIAFCFDISIVIFSRWRFLVKIDWQGGLKNLMIIGYSM